MLTTPNTPRVTAARLDGPCSRLAGFHSYCIRRERQVGFGPVKREPLPSFDVAYEGQRLSLQYLAKAS